MLLLLVSILAFLLTILTTASITITIPLRECCWIRSDKHPKAEQHCQTNSNENIRR
jgi:hypothetical protein